MQKQNFKRQNRSARMPNGRLILPLLVMMWLMMPHCVGHCDEKALHIDADGRVGIGTSKPQARLDVAGDIMGIGMVPPGGIVMFFGDIDAAFDPKGKGIAQTPYEGWQLCNGENGSPDLRGRFVAGAGGAYAVGVEGGADTVSLTQDQMPEHSHKGKTEAAGLHQHWIEGTDAKGLAKRKRRIPGETTVKMGYGGGSNRDPNHEHWRGLVNTDVAGGHGHTFTTGAAGKNQAHENRPSYFALAFIIRLPVNRVSGQ